MKKLVGTALLAGVTAAGFSVGAAFALGVSPVVAGTVTGSITAIVVAAAIYRDDERRPNGEL